MKKADKPYKIRIYRQFEDLWEDIEKVDTILKTKKDEFTLGEGATSFFAFSKV